MFAKKPEPEFFLAGACVVTRFEAAFFGQLGGFGFGDGDAYPGFLGIDLDSGIALYLELKERPGDQQAVTSWR